MPSGSLFDTANQHPPSSLEGILAKVPWCWTKKQSVTSANRSRLTQVRYDNVTLTATVVAADENVGTPALLKTCILSSVFNIPVVHTHEQDTRYKIQAALYDMSKLSLHCIDAVVSSVDKQA